MNRLVICVLCLAVLACSTQAAIYSAPPREYSRSMSTDDLYLRHVSRHGVLQIDARKPRE